MVAALVALALQGSALPFGPSKVEVSVWGMALEVFPPHDPKKASTSSGGVVPPPTRNRPLEWASTIVGIDRLAPCP